ncbi:MAG: hypothetical protein ACJ72E_07260 [Marmoricola sp.]
MRNDPTPPVADDDFAEFAEPPRQRPQPGVARSPAEARPPESEQGAVDEVLARLRRERAEGKR